MARLAAGDAEAAAELYDRYAGRVYAVARRILRNDGDAEDVVQEVFTQAWRSAAGYSKQRGSVTSWLMVMTRTRSIDRLRAQQSRPVNDEHVHPDTMQAADMPVPERLVADEDASRVRAALSGLPDAQRRPLELAYFEGLTQVEIATRLAEPIGTVKTRMRAALTTLRTRLRTDA